MADELEEAERFARRPELVGDAKAIRGAAGVPRAMSTTGTIGRS